MQTPQEALNNLRAVVAKFETSGVNHAILNESLAVLEEAIKPKPEPAKE